MSDKLVEDMAQSYWAQFEIGRMLPDFRLPSVEGSMISPLDYKEKMGLAVLYFDIERTDDWGVLWEVARRKREFDEANAQLLAVVNATKSEAEICLGDFRLPFPVLYNESLAEHGPLADRPKLITADRFGEVKTVDDVTSENVDRILDRAVTRLELSEMECPECGAPTWAI
jgi:hypothetical protein